MHPRDQEVFPELCWFARAAYHDTPCHLSVTRRKDTHVNLQPELGGDCTDIVLLTAAWNEDERAESYTLWKQKFAALVRLNTALTLAGDVPGAQSPFHYGLWPADSQGWGRKFGLTIFSEPIIQNKLRYTCFCVYIDASDPHGDRYVHELIERTYSFIRSGQYVLSGAIVITRDANLAPRKGMTEYSVAFNPVHFPGDANTTTSVLRTLATCAGWNIVVL